MMNEEINVQIVFPFLGIQRFLRCRRSLCLNQMIHQFAAMDDSIHHEIQYLFDNRGKRVNPECSLSEFGEENCIQLFAV